MSIINFLKELKYSFPDAEDIYLGGKCFRLFKILQTIFPQAQPYYSDLDGHWITEIDGKYYDINGEVSYDYVVFRQYSDREEDSVMLQSAYIGGRYDKYKKSV